MAFEIWVREYGSTTPTLLCTVERNPGPIAKAVRAKRISRGLPTNGKRWAPLRYEHVSVREVGDDD